jgi:tRNA threonylcarbamoyl adenosine modification protein YeaZ
MKILALEFSSERRGVAVFDAGVVRGAVAATGHVPGAMELIEAALREAGVEREAIECIAIGIGPGSYTGIRTAIALAQGWELSRGVKLLGISSIDVLAATARAAGLRGAIWTAIDAHRGDFYSADCEVSDTGFEWMGSVKIIARNELLRVAGKMILGPEADHLGGIAMFPEAIQLGLLAAGRSEFVAGEKLEPIYLREAHFVKAPPPRAAALR